ncbi:type II secretion system protein GspM [Bordetella genomosp. 12]|uniref:General secretion pathway protein GspM n=1 Tax=Bordetella genomosp. 12 TaxID=463035 RepID=A0A261VFG0_9BORD|nr:type II secretion system protein GspM [Bordetella genomosp. 12]OZI71893.1 hypothetical protein CAL22_19110 [Bordetella genomosp. 12]
MKALTPAWQKLRQRINPSLRELRQRHAALSTRDRRLLQAMAVTLGATALWLLGVEPALNQVMRLHAELPQLRVQAAAIDDLAAQAASLARQAPARATLPAQAELQHSLSQAGLSPDRWILSPDKDGYQLRVSEVPAQTLLDWLARSSQDWSLTARQAELVRATNPYGRPLPGLVNGKLLLSLRQGG